MDVSQYPAKELAPWFSLAEPAIGKVMDNALLLTPGNVLNRLDNILSPFIRVITQKAESLTQRPLCYFPLCPLNNSY
jgi:hypothetical protein